MPVNLEQIGFVTIVDIIPNFVKSLYMVLPITIIIGAIIGVSSTRIYERIDGFKEKNSKSDKVIYE
jgi:hypothetical protein